MPHVSLADGRARCDAIEAKPGRLPRAGFVFASPDGDAGILRATTSPISCKHGRCGWHLFATEEQFNGGRGVDLDVQGRPVTVTAFTQGRNIPSSRLRVRQLINPMARHGVQVHEETARWKSYPPRPWLARPLWAVGNVASRIPQVARSRRSDVCLLQREFLARHRTLERLTGRPRVFDVDDAIHLDRGGKGPAQAIARASDLVVCGNEHLARTYRDWAPRVEVLATAVDTAFYRPASPERSNFIVWVGSASNVAFLERIARALRRVLAERPGTRLAIVSDLRPALADEPGVDFVPWTPGAERAALSGAAIGLMPLPDNEWARGKCSYKMLASMASGLPVVVSPVGMNQELLDQAEVGFGASEEEQWVEALLRLLDDPALRARLGGNGRALAEARYGVDAAAARYATWLRELAGGP